MLTLISLLTLCRLQKHPIVNLSLDQGPHLHPATPIQTTPQTVAIFLLFLRLEKFAGHTTMLMVVELLVVSEDVEVVWVEALGVWGVDLDVRWEVLVVALIDLEAWEVDLEVGWEVLVADLIDLDALWEVVHWECWECLEVAAWVVGVVGANNR